MLKKEMEDALNKQINEELYSAYLYLSMSAYLDAQGLSGFARWMRVQFQEELKHALKIYDYILLQNAMVNLLPVKEPQHTWDSIEKVFENVYEHEKYITSKIYELVDLANKLKDNATNNFLQWFVDEQVEEEKSTYDILNKVKMAKGHVGALLQLDKILGERES